jgi:hypothetical protein
VRLVLACIKGRYLKPFVVSLSNHAAALRQAQGERYTPVIYVCVDLRKAVLGSQRNPWGLDNIRRKFRANAGMVLPEDKVEGAMKTWADIAQVTDIAGAIRATLVNSAWQPRG